MARKKKGLTPVGDILTPGLLREISGPTPIEQRLIDGAAFQTENPDTPRDLLYQHTVLCQTCFLSVIPGMRSEHGKGLTAVCI